MIYGILLESCRDGICTMFGQQTWKKIVQELKFDHETFTMLGRYEENMIEQIAECLCSILHEGSPDFYMRFFGECFVRFFTTYGYDKILRVAGRNLRDFLHSIDQLHDSTRFSFPEMKSPLFSVAEEDEQGIVLMYKTRRRGFQHYVIGQLRECAKNFYNEDIQVTMQEDLSTNEYTRIMFRVDFNNEIIKKNQFRLMKQLVLPDITSSTFFMLFPFCVVIDPEMRISQLGPRLKSLFTVESRVIGRHISDVLTLIRPDILHIEWEKFLKYGKSVVFVMESCIQLRATDTNTNGTIKLKGQMKYIPSWNKLVFLCHPMLTTIEEMLSIGLFLNDLNFYDGSSEILVGGIQHAKQLQIVVEKQQTLISQLQNSRNELQKYRKIGKQLLDSLMPRHIEKMLQQNIPANSICESHKLLTILFSYSIDIKDIIQKLTPEQVVNSVDRIINCFDACTENFNVFKLGTKADSSYLVAAGIEDRTAYESRRNSIISCSTNYSSMFMEDGNATMFSRSSYITNNNHIIGDIQNNSHDIHFIHSNPKNPYDLNQAETICALSLEIMEVSGSIINPLTKQPFRMKFGFHSGSAVGGIIGNCNYQYCLFGDAINMANRVAESSEVGKIQLSATSYELLKDSPYFDIVYRGKTEMKGKDCIDTYWLCGPTQIYLTLFEAIRKHPVTTSDLNNSRSTLSPNRIKETQLTHPFNELHFL